MRVVKKLYKITGEALYLLSSEIRLHWFTLIDALNINEEELSYAVNEIIHEGLHHASLMLFMEGQYIRGSIEPADESSWRAAIYKFLPLYYALQYISSTYKGDVNEDNKEVC